jgi:hypothetical protein
MPRLLSPVETFSKKSLAGNAKFSYAFQDWLQKAYIKEPWRRVCHQIHLRNRVGLIHARV